MLNRMGIHYARVSPLVLLLEDMVKRFIVVTCIVIMYSAILLPTGMPTLEDIAR